MQIFLNRTKKVPLQKGSVATLFAFNALFMGVLRNGKWRAKRKEFFCNFCCSDIFHLLFMALLKPLPMPWRESLVKNEKFLMVVSNIGALKPYVFMMQNGTRQKLSLPSPAGGKFISEDSGVFSSRLCVY